GLRVPLVTGVQTCALPISAAFKVYTTVAVRCSADAPPAFIVVAVEVSPSRAAPQDIQQPSTEAAAQPAGVKITNQIGSHLKPVRSEERRVGQACVSWAASA